MVQPSMTVRTLAAFGVAVLLLSACSRGGDSDGNGDSDSSASRSSVRDQRSSGSRRSQSNVSSRRSSSRSASSEKAASGSSAPFFSLRKSSSSRSVASSSKGGASSAVASAAAQSSSDDAVSGSVRLSVDADRLEARPGDLLFYTVTVKNISDQTVNDLRVVYSFSPSQLSITESDGVLSPDRIQWTIDSLAPGQNRALRFRAQLAQTLDHGATVRGTAVATIDGASQPEGALSEVRVLNQLPTTGLGDGTRPFENTRRFLRPFSEPEAGSVVPVIVWTATILMGLALGASAAKRYL